MTNEVNTLELNATSRLDGKQKKTRMLHTFGKYNNASAISQYLRTEYSQRNNRGCSFF